MKIGIVSPSAAAVAALRDAVVLASSARVAWVTSSAESAADLQLADPVDVLLFDVDARDPVVIPTSRQARGAMVVAVTARASSGTSRVYTAMGQGAVDVLPLDAGRAAMARVLGALAGAASRGASAPSTGLPPIVALGASTGGPAALLTVLSSFPRGMRAAVILCQHVEASFSSDMVSWLSHESGHAVSLVTQRTTVRAGSVYLAAPGSHLVLDGESLCQSASPAGAVHVPSIDVLLHSLARGARRHCSAAALLTGMGRDGADGLLAMRAAGMMTIAQDEATSVVYSMPRAAKENRAASRILPIEAIGPALATFVASLGSHE